MWAQLIKRRPRGNEGGFTLLEVIIAISILSVGLLAVASMQVAAIHGNSFAYDISEAVTLAQDRMEYLSSLPFDSALLQPGSNKSDPLAPTPPGYTLTYDVANNTPITNVKSIQVTVTPPPRRGAARQQIILRCVKPAL